MEKIVLILSVLSVSLWLMSPVWAEPARSFEEAAKAEGQRQRATEDSPEAAQTSSLDTAVDSVNAPVIHLPKTPQKVEEKEKSTPADDLTEREERQWLLTGVMKLEGSYEESLTEEERKALKERRERLGEVPRFVDHVAALKEKQREAGDLGADSIEARFATEADRQFGMEPDAYLESMEEVWLLQSNPVQGPQTWRRWDPTLVTARQHMLEPTIGSMPEPVRTNPYLSEAGIAPVENRFLEPYAERPSPVLELSRPEPKLAPVFIPDPAPEAPADEVRRYRPEKDIDEKYFKDLRRF